jgi:hypothetical protein
MKVMLLKRPGSPRITRASESGEIQLKIKTKRAAQIFEAYLLVLQLLLGCCMLVVCVVVMKLGIN